MVPLRKLLRYCRYFCNYYHNWYLLITLFTSYYVTATLVWLISRSRCYSYVIAGQHSSKEIVKCRRTRENFASPCLTAQWTHSCLPCSSKEVPGSTLLTLSHPAPNYWSNSSAECSQRSNTDQCRADRISACTDVNERCFDAFACWGKPVNADLHWVNRVYWRKVVRRLDDN